MNENHLWNRAKQVKIQTSGKIVGGFDIGFDSKIPEETKDALIRFVYWVEDHFSMPVTLWVDFKYNHYLVDKTGKRVGYKFYWADWEPYPVLDSWDDIPVIELPVRTENWTMKEILGSFVQAITCYFMWLAAGRVDQDPEDALVEEILRNYLNEGE
jgi:hypothetical protein